VSEEDKSRKTSGIMPDYPAGVKAIMKKGDRLK